MELIALLISSIVILSHSPPELPSVNRELKIENVEMGVWRSQVFWRLASARSEGPYLLNVNLGKSNKKPRIL
jgi:hypothetical protein